MGLIATTLPGVRPSISLASRPTASTSPLFLLIATIEGSFTTIPLPCENTSVFAVPRSIARSEENKLNTDRRLYPFLFIPRFPPRRPRPAQNRLFSPDLTPGAKFPALIFVITNRPSSFRGHYRAGWRQL